MDLSTGQSPLGKLGALFETSSWRTRKMTEQRRWEESGRLVRTGYRKIGEGREKD